MHHQKKTVPTTELNQSVSPASDQSNAIKKAKAINDDLEKLRVRAPIFGMGAGETWARQASYTHWRRVRRFYDELREGVHNEPLSAARIVEVILRKPDCNVAQFWKSIDGGYGLKLPGEIAEIYFSSFLEGAVAWDENEDLRMADGRRVEMNISWQGDRVEFRVVD